MVGRCAEYGEDASYAPLREALAPLVGPDGRAWLERTLAGDPEGEIVATQVSSVLHEGSVVPVVEAAWAMRRLLEALARQKPLLLVLDDVQWAAPALLDLVESVVELVAAPVLVLCLSRPELLDVRPFWGGGRLSSSSLLLDALSDSESEQLLATLVESEGMDEAVREGSSMSRTATRCSWSSFWHPPSRARPRRSRTRSTACLPPDSTTWRPTNARSRRQPRSSGSPSRLGCSASSSGPT